MISRISVIVPVFNHAALVGEALSSVWCQNYPNLELIVVDDGSSDGLREIERQCGPAILLRTRETRGPAAARNHGLKHATGSIIAFLDADDVWPDGRLQTLLAPLRSEPEIAVSLGRTRILRQSDTVPEVFSLSADAHFGVQLGGGLFRRRVFETVGTFEESLRYSEDHDWFFRARELGVRVVLIEADALYHRIHCGGMTQSSDRAAGFGLPRVIKRSLERRRALQGVGTPPSLPKFGHFERWTLPA